MTEQKFNLLMAAYLSGSASRAERIELMNLIAADEEYCELFNEIIYLTKEDEDPSTTATDFTDHR